jgi:mitochondrial ATPase complex subunit ATP10
VSHPFVGPGSKLLSPCCVGSSTGTGPSTAYLRLRQSTIRTLFGDRPSTGPVNFAKDMETPHRHMGIKMHPNSISGTILPDNYVYRNPARNDYAQRIIELVHGYFWMLKDIRWSNKKPMLADTEKLIPETIAKVFPVLTNLKFMGQGWGGEKVNLPDYFVRKNRSRDAAAQCTLVVVSFRDFGYQMLPSWVNPLRIAMDVGFVDKDRVEIIRMNVSEGWLNRYILRPVVTFLMRRNTPVHEHGWTLLSFHRDLSDFRDALRMHNVMVGYAFLLDGLGRVRFAGSGEATQEEAHSLILFAKELTSKLKKEPSRKGKGTKRKHRIVNI